MNVTDAVRQAHSPQAAMLTLAEALDRIEQKIDSLQTAAPPPADPWGSWTPVEQADDAEHRRLHAELDDHEVDPDGFGFGQALSARLSLAEDSFLIEDLEQQMALETDPENIQALSARLRLLKDTGQPMGDPSDPTTVQMEHDGDTTTIVLPPSDQARIQARAVWAAEHKLTEFLPQVDPADLMTGFAKGGLLWLYHMPGGREALLSMPVLYRQQLVTDLETDSPRLAQEVGRDILAREESMSPGDAVDAIERLADNISNPAF